MSTYLSTYLKAMFAFEIHTSKLITAIPLKPDFWYFVPVRKVDLRFITDDWLGKYTWGARLLIWINFNTKHK